MSIRACGVEGGGGADRPFGSPSPDEARRRQTVVPNRRTTSEKVAWPSSDQSLTTG